ncbi:MAG: Anhydro-N-acetylmuramic acid kinase [Candidatus Celerinatantimonas neptuna]|nr:MAG: Anhydro-N-acetylmuramic acid kinase [Candidatus Celerinatantimonas neptuna]
MQDIYIGVMSGTSLDGIDAVAVDFTLEKPKLLECHHAMIPPDLRQELMDLSLDKPRRISDIGATETQLARIYAKSINTLLKKLNLSAKDIQAIGCHGQTVCHNPTTPNPFSIQLNDPSLIAARTKITTVADFRRKDLAYGGQGAPFVPIFHQALFEKQKQTVVVLNIGGIANISVIRPGYPTLGYDTGPGNMLMDAWIQQSLTKNFDFNGQWARSGQPDSSLLNELLADPYFKQSSPKSTGREYFNLNWLQRHRCDHEPPEDIQATLLCLTIESIALEVEKFPVGKLLVCGGGAHNQALMDQLALRLSKWKVTTTNAEGINGDAMEAMAFAWLARQTIRQKSGNLPEVTGAQRKAILGGIYYADT